MIKEAFKGKTSLQQNVIYYDNNPRGRFSPQATTATLVINDPKMTLDNLDKAINELLAIEYEGSKYQNIMHVMIFDNLRNGRFSFNMELMRQNDGKSDKFAILEDHYKI
jgi:hypothetical protein